MSDQQLSSASTDVEMSNCQLVSRSEDVEMRDLEMESHVNETSTSRSMEVILENDEIETLRAACNKKAHLDGKFYQVDYEKSSMNGPIVGTCSICYPTKTIKGTLTTSTNFIRHYKRCHREVFDENFDEHKRHKRFKLVDEGLIGQRKKNGVCNFSQSTFEQNVADYILNSMAPFSTVEMPSFRKIFDAMDITVKAQVLRHISRRTLTRRIRQLFDQHVQGIRKVLARALYVCTTADIWTASTRRFIGVTVHWIDPHTWQRHSAAIACRRFPGSHTYDEIAKLLENIHGSFGLDTRKIVATITDNASNFAKAFREFGVTINMEINPQDGSENPARTERDDSGSDSDSSDAEDDNLLAENEYSAPNDSDEYVNTFDGLPRHFRCASHTLNLLATTDVLKTIKTSRLLMTQFNQTIERCQCLWKLLRSPKQRELLTGILGQSLSKPVVVRWNSLFSSLQQIYDLREKIDQANRALNVANPLRESDFNFVAEYLICLRPVSETIDKLQGENNCFYGYLLPSLVSLRRRLQIIKSSNNLIHCQSIVNDLIVNLETRFHDFFTVEDNGIFAAIAAALMPPFKTRWLKCLSRTAQEAVNVAVVKAANEIPDLSPPHGAHAVVQSGITDNFFDFGEEDLPTSRSLECSETELEMRKFLSDPCNDNIGSIDQYPKIKHLFLYYNTPLPSSAPVERLFSYATMMNLPRYNRLTDENFEKRILAKCNSSIVNFLQKK